jgi:hypothetical protein
VRPPVRPPTVVFFNKKITQQSTNDDDDLHRLRNTLLNAIMIKAQCRMLHLGIANTAIMNFLIDIIFFFLSDVVYCHVAWFLIFFILNENSRCSVFSRTTAAFVVLVKCEVMYVGFR